ncbi:hypothetical protein CORC01_08090 [Colletotrichum orchidophilum]|uniref:Death domain-containing protein n=1 Tax=Colletotrichum orchidophilum TaxID=1209926 RepID=A0A1G4B5P5_9PEZI|nr:uncharacterized protein CORC01_08090 [Colletotrichum orchidophilum]OHE96633.1 hypothetical protein CORC01_08090 [Colletotrichum orchidophilum]
MAGEQDEKVSGKEISRGQKSSREEYPATTASRKDKLRVRTSSRQDSETPLTNEGQQEIGSETPTSSAHHAESPIAAKPSRASWASMAMAGNGATGGTFDMRSVTSSSQDVIPSQAMPSSAVQNPSSSRPASPAVSLANRSQDQTVPSDSASRNSSVSRRGGSVSRGRGRNSNFRKSTAPARQQGQTSRPSSPAPYIESTESKRFEEIKSYLRSLAESHNIVHLIEERSVSGRPETTPTTCEQLFKNFASKVSEECSTRHKKLQDEASKLEASRQAHAQLKGEKTALQQVVAKQKDKLGEIGPLEQKTRNLEDQFKQCTTERDESKSELQATQEKLNTAELECNEKEIALQRVTAGFSEVQMRIQQMVPPVNEEELQNTISELRDQLKDEFAARAAAERGLQEERGDWQFKEKRYEDSVAYVEKQCSDFQKQIKEAEATAENLQAQLMEQTRKASRAQTEVENMTFTVDHKIVPLDQYRKLVDNARGEISDLEKRLNQAETDRDVALHQDVSMDDVREMMMGDFVGLYGLAMDDAACNLYNNWQEEEARLSDMVGDGNDGFHRYPHAVVLPDQEPSQPSSDDLFSPKRKAPAAVELKSDTSQAASEPEAGRTLANELSGFSMESSMEPEETQSSPNLTQQTLEGELNRLSRVSSAESDGSKVDQGDSSLQLRNIQSALDECQNHRKEAHREIKDLKDDAKKLVNEIAELKASVRTLQQSIKDHESNADRMREEAEGLSAIQMRDKQNALNECETHRKEANKKIKDLEETLRKRIKELKGFQNRDAFLSRASEQLKEQLSAVNTKLGKAEAKAAFADARETLANEAPEDRSSTGSPSLHDPESHVQLVTDLFDRLDEAETKLAASHKDLAEVQDIVVGLGEDAKQLREERDHLSLEKAQLQEEKLHLAQERDALKEDLKLWEESTQEVGVNNVKLLEEVQKNEKEMQQKNEEIKSKDEEIQKKDGEIREKDAKLKEKEEELKKKQKALDDCHAHGERLKKEVAELKNSQIDESEDPRIAALQEEIQRLEEKVTDFRNKWSGANERYRRELERRVEVEEQGVDHLRSRISKELVDKDKELRDAWMTEHNKVVEGLNERINALERSHEGDAAELERIKAEHQKEVDELELKIRSLESQSPAVDADAVLTNIKDEHQRKVDELEVTILSLESQNEGLSALLSGMAAPSGILTLEQGTQTQDAPIEDSRQDPEYQSPSEETLETTAIHQHIPTEFVAMHQRFKDQFNDLLQRQRNASTMLDEFFRHISGTLGGMDLPAQPNDDEFQRLRDLLDAINKARREMHELGVQKEDFWEANVLNQPAELYRLEMKIELFKTRLVAAEAIEANQRAEERWRGRDDGGHSTGESGDENQPDQPENSDDGSPSRDNASSDSDDDDSDEDGPDPGNDPKKLRRAIAKLEKKSHRAGLLLKEEESKLRRMIDHHGEIFNQLYQTLGNPREPFRQILRESVAMREAEGGDAVVAGSCSNAGAQPNVAEPPLPPDFPVSRPQDGRDKWGGKKKAHRFPDDDPDSSGDDSSSFFDADGDQYGGGDQSPKRTPQEARIRAIHKVLKDTREHYKACLEARDAVLEATRHLSIADDPIRHRPRPAPSTHAAHPLPSIPADEDPESQPGPSSNNQPATPGSQSGESERAFKSHNAFDELDTDASSMASSELVARHTTDRLLSSFLPRSIYNPLIVWAEKCEEIQYNLRSLDHEIEGLIHDGVNSQNYEFLRSRAREFKIRLEKANETIIALKARKDGEVAGPSDNELVEAARKLKDENSSLLQELDEVKRMAKDKQTDLGRKLIKARAESNTHQQVSKYLRNTIYNMEFNKKKVIEDGVDERIRETTYYYEKQKDEIKMLESEASELRKKLDKEQSTRSEPLDTAFSTIQSLTDELGEMRKRNEMLEDMSKTLATDMERALEITGGPRGTVEEKLARMRERISNALHQNHSGSTNPGGDGEDPEEEVEYFSYEAETDRERELAEMVNEAMKQAAKQLEHHNRRYNKQQKDFHDRNAELDAEKKSQQSDSNKLVAQQERRIQLCEKDRQAALEQVQRAERDKASLEEQLQQQYDITAELMLQQDDENLKAAERGASSKESGQDEKGKQREGAPGDDPDDDPGDSSGGSSDAKPNDGPRGSSDRKSRRRSGKKCSCPCLGGCDSRDKPAREDTNRASRQAVVGDLVKVYKLYRDCCGSKHTKNTDGSNATGTAVPEDDGLLLWRLAGIMKTDSDTRERIRNQGRRTYLARLLIAFWSCICVHVVSWQHVFYGIIHNFVFFAVYFLPGSSWKPSEPAALPPKRVALVLKDAVILYWFYYLYQALTATWAVQRIYDMANGYTRAYFIERALHPQRSRWWGIDGIDTRLLPGFSSAEPSMPSTTGGIGK